MVSPAPLAAGASTGIGRHAAEYLAQQGFTVLAGVRRQTDADAIQDPNLPNLVPVMLDVTDSESIQGVGKARSNIAFGLVATTVVVVVESNSYCPR